MKFTNEVTINLPRARVVELFDNPDNMKQWQKGMESFEREMERGGGRVQSQCAAH